MADSVFKESFVLGSTAHTRRAGTPAGKLTPEKQITLGLGMQLTLYVDYAAEKLYARGYYHPTPEPPDGR